MDKTSQTFPWAEPTEVVLGRLDVDSKRGLSSDEAKQRLDEHGPNELSHAEKASHWQLFLEQFDDALVKVLLVAAAISFGLALLQDADEGEGIREFIEPFVILLILILNAIVGVWQESNAENALESALKDCVCNLSAIASPMPEGHWSAATKRFKRALSLSLSKPTKGSTAMAACSAHYPTKTL